MQNAQPKVQLPNLSMPRTGQTESNPEGFGVFFAVTRLAISKTAWSRQDFEAVQIVEGQLNALEVFFENNRKEVAAVAQAKAAAPVQPVAQAPKAEVPVQAPTPSTPQNNGSVDSPAPVPVNTNNVSSSNPVDNNAVATETPQAEQEKKN